MDINEIYKGKLEDAYASGAGDNIIIAIMNEHQKALDSYMKEAKLKKNALRFVSKSCVSSARTLRKERFTPMRSAA